MFLDGNKITKRVLYLIQELSITSGTHKYAPSPQAHVLHRLGLFKDSAARTGDTHRHQISVRPKILVSLNKH